MTKDERLAVLKSMTPEQRSAYGWACSEAAFWKNASRHERLMEIAKDCRRYHATEAARAKHGFTVWQKSMQRGVQALSKALTMKSVGMGAMLTIGQEELVVKSMSNPLTQIVIESANAERAAIERSTPFEAYDPGPTPEPEWQRVGSEIMKGTDVRVTVLKHRGRPGQTLYVDPEGEWVVVNKNGEVLDSGALDLEEEEITS
jgi:hypothetical protein